MTHTILSAALFAARRHRTQRRKDPEASPFINHPLEVAQILASHGVEDLTVLQAALLHDTVEDTETTPEELAEAFGAEVAALVMEVTDDKSLPKATRKELQVRHASGSSASVKLVKIADKISNVRDVSENPPEGWDRTRRLEYLAWSRAVVDGCRGVNAALEAHFDRVVAAAEERVGATGE